ncbi:MAG: glutamate racemase [Tissierellia bacterium]|nr:glutamate racemase [Tissierellia bacterium]
MDDRYIGVFDSGLGGITVLRELKKLMPHEKFIFLADTLRSPYGEKSEEDLYKIVFSNIDYLISRGVKAVVFACNTASSLDLDLIRSSYQIPLITVLEATLEEITDKDKKILVAATEATVKSGKHKKLIEERFKESQVLGVACKDIVSAIEFANPSFEDTLNIVEGYLGAYADQAYDSLILGCTHYPIWTDQFSLVLPGLRIINPAHATALLTKKTLEDHNILGRQEKEPTREDLYLITSDKDVFIDKLKKIFGISPKNVEKVRLN